MNDKDDTTQGSVTDGAGQRVDQDPQQGTVGSVVVLSDDEPPLSLNGTATGNDVIKVKNKELELKKELLSQRFKLARAMLAVTAALAVMILGSAFLASDASYEQLKELAPIVFTPVVTLLGTSIAWYYASDSNKKD